MTTHEETDNSLHFVIPAKPNVKLAELSDEELEKAAGGYTPTITLTIWTVSVTVSVTHYITDNAPKWK
jgi:hypothetical protein